MSDVTYFDYLLLTSLQIRQYKLVTRDWLDRLFSSSYEWCDCSYCGIRKIIKSKLDEIGYETYNRKVDWWKITQTWGKIIVTPE